MKRILIAGIGNIFLGDDAFGVEVAKALLQRPLPRGVRVVDFGIRGYDLAYTILEGYDATILVDAVSRGEPPGTVFLIQPDAAKGDGEPCAMNAHQMTPLQVLAMVRWLGGEPQNLYVVGCEPAVLEPEAGEIALSPAVNQAVPIAVGMIEELLDRLLGAKGSVSGPSGALGCD
jgi:hydrogenase maturation protease